MSLKNCVFLKCLSFCFTLENQCRGVVYTNFTIMRFNSRELAFLAQQPANRFDKEGILFIKEKQEGLFRKGEGENFKNISTKL